MFEAQHDDLAFAEKANDSPTAPFLAVTLHGVP
jgi:hypothetical protein